MDGLGTAVGDALAGIDTELLVVVPLALGIAGITWGAPLIKRFFKRLAS